MELKSLVALPGLLVIAACGSIPPAPAPAPEPALVEPRVDMTCVQRARDGELLDGLPAELDGFRVTPAAGGVHLHRGGRELTAAESETLWKQMADDVFAPGGIAMGHSGHSSIFTCDDAPKNDCFKLQSWICQADLATLAARLTTAVEHAGVPDAMISVDIVFEEARGPSCRDGAACTPAPHYSLEGRYDPSRPRHAEIGWSAGRCRDDGDCEGAHSNRCVAWYLRGGIESAIEILRMTPGFCGCVEQRCRWFTQ